MLLPDHPYDRDARLFSYFTLTDRFVRNRAVRSQADPLQIELLLGVPKLGQDSIIFAFVKPMGIEFLASHIGVSLNFGRRDPEMKKRLAGHFEAALELRKYNFGNPRILQ